MGPPTTTFTLPTLQPTTTTTVVYVEPGTHTFVVVAVDGSGNRSSPSNAFVLQVC